MPPLANQVYYDVYDGNGTLLLQDQGPIYSTTTSSKFGYGCKLHGSSLTHLLTVRDQSAGTMEAILERITGFLTSTTIASTSLGTLDCKGLARLDNVPGLVDYRGFAMIDRNATPDALYLLDLAGTTFSVDTPCNAVATNPPAKCPCFIGSAFVVNSVQSAGVAEPTFYLSRGSGAPGSDYLQAHNLCSRSPLNVDGIAWNGRRAAIFYNDGGTPPSAYTIDLVELGPSVANAPLSYTLATRSGTFPGDGSADGFLGGVDIDWDGRHWIVWYNCEVDIGA